MVRKSQPSPLSKHCIDGTAHIWMGKIQKFELTVTWPTYLKIVDFVEYSPARSESFVNLCFIILTVTSEKLWFEIQRQAMILYLTKYLLRKELLKSFTYCWTHFPIKSLLSIFLLFICSWEWNRSRQLGYSSLVTWWGVNLLIT